MGLLHNRRVARPVPHSPDPFLPAYLVILQKCCIPFRPVHKGNVRFGSLAASLANSSLVSAFERKAAVRRSFFRSFRLNVRFSRKRTFRLVKFRCFLGPLSARSGHDKLRLTTKLTGGSVAWWSCCPVARLASRLLYLAMKGRT